ncbi:ATP-binding protein [Telmatobacter bradus]|uniref:sensor histidine kinase n=1 Tax=Telmatobacter bradus TaxID=474953 RepID=UPI003B42AF05
MRTRQSPQYEATPAADQHQDAGFPGSGPDPALDELTELVAVLCNADSVYISRAEADLLLFQSHFGFRGASQPLTASACQWVIESGEPLLIADAARNPHFSPTGIPLPGASACRSYVGVPLLSDDRKTIGTLAMLNTTPDQFRPDHLPLLEIMAHQVETRFELYRSLHSQEQALRAHLRTERALAIERCFVSATLDSIPALVAVLDTAGRLVRMNEACAQLTGLERNSTVGRLFVEEILDAEDRARVTEKLREAACGQDSDPQETSWRTMNGSDQKCRVRWTLRPLSGPDGEVQYLILSGQDVSERIHMEQMKDEFISTISHELKTPLASLRGSLGLIQSGQLDKRPEKQTQMIELAIANCDRLTRLVNDILDFDKVDHGRLQLHREAVDAANLLRRAADVAHPTATRAGIHIRVDANEAMVFADQERILRVLNELIANALKFSAAETTLRMIVRTHAKPAPDTEPGEVLFVVADQGRGIAPENLERIFERFQQGDASDARSLGGTGIGLALCRAIIEQHGGHIWAESEPGKGSRLLFTLPEA